MFKKITLTVATLSAGMLFMAVTPTAQAASHDTIPASLRGTWYTPYKKYSKGKYRSTGQFTVTSLKAHSLTTWRINKKGHQVTPAAILLSSKYKHDYRHLKVTKSSLFNKKHRYAYNLPDMKLQHKQPKGRHNTIGATDGWAFWTTTRKYKGKTYKVLESYQRMGYVMAASKKKVNHDFTYTAKSQKSFSELGFKK